MWRVAYTSLDEGGISIAIRCLRKLFYIEVVTDDLGNWSKKQEFIHLLQDAQDGDIDAEESLYDLIWNQCLHQFSTSELATSDVSTPFSLQDYYGVNALSFKLIENGTDVQLVPYPGHLANPIEFLRPQIELRNIVDSSSVPRVDASRLRIRPLPSSDDPDIGSDAPTIVSLEDESKLYNFKSVQDHPSFLREFEILRQLAEHRLNKKYRLPVLYSLVTYSDKPEVVMGMLLHHIDHDGSMSDWISARNPSRNLREKWNNQIKDMVRALHRHDIVWGDVKPDNVLIDHCLNAWIIDFGGGFNSGYVDEVVMETVEGDNQGISRIAETLLYGKEY